MLLIVSVVYFVGFIESGASPEGSGSSREVFRHRSMGCELGEYMKQYYILYGQYVLDSFLAATSCGSCYAKTCPDSRVVQGVATCCLSSLPRLGLVPVM